MQKPRENLYNKKKLGVLLVNLRWLFSITSFDLLEILCRIYVPFIFRERFLIKMEEEKERQKEKEKSIKWYYMWNKIN